LVNLRNDTRRSSGESVPDAQQAVIAMRKLGYVPALDGLRGIAILLVIGRHYFLWPLGGGGAGVNLFFVLSGYLITTLLFEEHAATGRISLTGFYQRRARRLVPALAVMLLAYLVGASITGGFVGAARAVAAGGFYTANIAQAYWPNLIGRRPIGPLWSLSLEEQFYLLWPLALLVLLRFGVRRRRVIVGLGVLIAAIWAERVWLTLGHANPQRILASPESSADALLCGVLVAYALQKERKRDEQLALVALLLLAFVAWAGRNEAMNGPLIDLAGAGLVMFAVQRQSWLSRALAWKPLVQLGVISYSLYLWHMLVFSWLEPAGRFAALAAALAVAWLSYRYVETPFRRRRHPAQPDHDSLAGQPAPSAGLAT
jgi:peptidoglycan/LPS O-acetylase OafA/YrhL